MRLGVLQGVALMPFKTDDFIVGKIDFIFFFFAPLGLLYRPWWIVNLTTHLICLSSWLTVVWPWHQLDLRAKSWKKCILHTSHLYASLSTLKKARKKCYNVEFRGGGVLSLRETGTAWSHRNKFRHFSLEPGTWFRPFDVFTLSSSIPLVLTPLSHHSYLHPVLTLCQSHQNLFKHTWQWLGSITAWVLLQRTKRCSH